MTDNERDPPAGSTKLYCHKESGSGWSPGLGFQWVPGKREKKPQEPQRQGCLSLLCLLWLWIG